MKRARDNAKCETDNLITREPEPRHQYDNQWKRVSDFEIMAQLRTSHNINTSLDHLDRNTVESCFCITIPFTLSHPRLFLVLILVALRHIQPQSLRVQVHFISSTCILQNLRDSSGVFDPLEVDV